MTKAERIFNETRRASVVHINMYGYQTNSRGVAIGLNRLVYDNEEKICMRTINSIFKILKEKREKLLLKFKLDILSVNGVNEEAKILNIVESTINKDVLRLFS